MAHPEPQDPTFYLATDMEQPASCPFAGGEVVVFTRRSPNKETVNEDGVAVIPYSSRSGVLAIADGVGGFPEGERAARVALEALARAVRRAAREDSDLRTGILDGIENANRAVIELGGAATTLAVAEVRDGFVRPYHVGDSIVMVTGLRGKLRLQTIAHSPTAYAVEAGVMDEWEALDHEERNLISNAVGSPEMRIEVGAPLKLHARDTLLLASDGLVDNVHPEEIVESIRKGKVLGGVESLARLCRLRMGSEGNGKPSKPDDLSVLVYRRIKKAVRVTV
jgi:serine/threonine protein phosphatase PrpC